ncbi:MAG TPA: hypothetical protein VKB79_01325 [Bryobacteraceae bacterium]|nr:hypothetical protein [Bryobacteraceae bacterium]
MHYPNRLAVEGEQLVVHRFSSNSLGLVSPGDLKPPHREETSERRSFWAGMREIFTSSETCTIPAVCVPPGALLALDAIAERLRRRYGLNVQEEVRFEQLTAEPYAYRDAVVFQNGTKLKLQELSEGQRVTVLALTSSQQEEPTISSPAPAQSTV